jgi:hypothetical protein
MNNKLTIQQRSAEDCPDCGEDPDDPRMHRVSCRRIGMASVGHEELQVGPPWHDWPDDVDPINPRATA